MSGVDRPGTTAGWAFDYDRTVALSDGVFAIALTLLVLTISFPELTGGAEHRLGTELGNRLPELFSYALSFAVLGYLWLRHHAFFRSLSRIDPVLAVLNLVYLAVVAFLPYPTRLLGVYGTDAVSVIVYSLTIVLVGTLSVLIRLHAERAGLTPPVSRESWGLQLTAPIVFLISVPIALASPTAAKFSWLLLLVPRLRRRVKARSPADSSTES